MMALRLDDQNPTASSRATPAPFSRLITLFVPKRFIESVENTFTPFISDVNEKIVQRGYIESDGQILVQPIDVNLEMDLIDDWGYAKGKRGHSPRPAAAVTHAEIPTWEIQRRDWGQAQRDYFGLENPYQLAEDSGEYTHWHVQFRQPGSSLAQGEKVAALLHGGRDSSYFYCPCHEASVVYTTRHRFICMGCGFLHAVPAAPLPVHPVNLLTGENWCDFFDQGGSRTDEEVDLSLIDFQDIEHTRMLWTTDQWEDARHKFLFFARSSPEEIANAIKGTEMDPTIFLNAGFEPVALPPPAAHQIAEDSVDVV